MADFFKKQNSSDRNPELSIYCRQGEYAGVAFPLKAGDTISIGKNPEISNIVLSDPGISRLHCTITYSESNDNYIVTDHSSNGVYLENGSRLTKEAPTPLPCNSSIFFGKEVQVFELQKAEDDSQKTEQLSVPPVIPLPRREPKVNTPAPDTNPTGNTYHPVPKCTHCGYVGAWKVESLLLPHHIIIFLLFLFFWGAGFIYLIIVIIIRLNKDRRAKICPQCKARNLWTFNY
ncbi:FHA domain-containing protein [Faecalicatena contorta]|uniref:FHA domain-containing protein n=1 Tax=Faecalicatena contorta TaxID=39482 RepID=UPI001F29C929|nr:FHA domain-containing protein [Faecalicatena contorta]MCF2683524.1 FHA domain-containing protein [Faecalicatena contorta]